MKQAVLTLAVLFSSFVLFPESSSAQVNEGFRLELGPNLGVGGNFRIFSPDVDADSQKLEALPSLGGHVAAELPLPYSSLGLYLGLGTIGIAETDTLASDRIGYFDLAFRPKFRLPIEAGSLTVEPFLAVPVGYSLAFNEEQRSGQDDTMHGFVVGATAGATLFFSSGMGVYVSAGWLHHHYFQETTIAATAIDVQTALNQADISVGATFAF